MPHLDPVNPLPPGPADSTEGQLARFEADPYAYLEAQEKQHGPLFTLNLGDLRNGPIQGVEGNGAWVFLTRPHQVKAMYQADESVVSGAQANKQFFGTTEASVGYIDGEAHRCRRAHLHKLLNGHQDYTPLVQRLITQCMAAWPRDTPFALFPELQTLTSQVIVEVVCGGMQATEREQIRCTLLKTENAHSSREQVQEADRATRAMIQQRLGHYLERGQDQATQDIFATLLRLGQQGDDSLTDEVVRDEVFSLLYTGFATTANTLAWAFVRILGDARVQERLTRELREALSERPLTREVLNELPYLDATLKETLRLHPVTPLNGVRMLKRPLELDGYSIPAGTILVHCAYLLQRSPEVYAEPERFLPERFLDAPVDPYAWGAFGGGKRICIGRGFSLQEMKMVLARVLTELRMERVGDLPGARQQGFFMAPADGGVCVIKTDLN